MATDSIKHPPLAMGDWDPNTYIYRTLFANLIGSTKKLANKIIYTYNIST